MPSRPIPTSRVSTEIQVAAPSPTCLAPNSNRRGRKPSSQASTDNPGRDREVVRTPATPADRRRQISRCRSARPMLLAAPRSHLRKISNTALRKHCIVFVSYFLLLLVLWPHKLGQI